MNQDWEFRIEILVVLCSVLQIAGFLCLVLVKTSTYFPTHALWSIIAISGFAALAKELIARRTTKLGTSSAFAGLGLIGISLVALSIP
ncbi:MAG: hypothetical protein HZB12_01615 [Candidatus Yonathbacteria bacterium]|nr:hypothetical protein [Candidatus Yonathbacteria bacterium]